MKKNAGMSLVELIVAMGLGAVVLTTLGILATSTFGMFDHVEKVSMIGDTFEELKATLRGKNQCTKNLKDVALVMTNQAGASVNKIQSYDQNLTTVISTVLEKNKEDHGLLVKDIRLRPMIQVDSSLMVAKLEITFHKIARGNGLADIVRTIPLYARTQSGKVIECWSRQDSGMADASQICKIISNGALDVFDDQTKKCKSGNGQWYDGNATTASCPAGTYLPPGAGADAFCNVNLPPGFEDSFPTVPVSFTDGSTFTVGRSPVRPIISGGKCICDWAADLPDSSFATAKCQILCIKP
jgi:hypothetical protein